MSTRQTPEPAADVLEELSSAAEAYRAARDAVEEHGRDAIEDVRDARRRAIELLAGYEDSATDTGREEFVNFAEFQAQFVGHVEELDDDLPRRDAFEAAKAAVEKTRLSERDFERAREALEPAAELAERLEALEAARDDLVAARKRAERRREELASEIVDAERLLELGEADLDAPIAELREPVERWNAGVRDAVDALRTEAPVRELCSVLERAERYPLVDLPSPSADLRAYLASSPAGEEPLAQVLEYADFSRSKLQHYVADADEFRRRVAPERSTLEAVGPEPLTVSWPPPRADVVPWRARELRGAIGARVADDAVAALRELASLARADPERYARLRTAAEADDALTAEDRRRIESGAVEDALAARREAVERVEDRLAEVPAP